MKNSNGFAFGKKNYILLFSGIFLLALGLIIMTMDKEPYGFGFLGIVLGPIIIMVGFIVEIFAIFVTDKAKEQ